MKKYSLPNIVVHEDNPNRKPFPAIAAAASLHDHLADENAKLRAQIRELEKEKRELEGKLWRLDQ